MKKCILLFTALWLSVTYATALPNSPVMVQQDAVGTPPEFPGGKQAMEQFISENLQYPEAAKQAGISGSVMLQFNVHPDGSISDIAVFSHHKNTDNPDLIAEAKRLVGLFPKFQPATIDGQAVEANFIVPIRFKKGSGKGGFRSEMNAARSYTDEKGRAVVEPDFADNGAMGLRKFLFRYLVIDPHEKEYDQMAGATVVLELTIDKEGNTKDVDIESSTCKLLNDRAKTIGKSLPKWKPGTIDGKAEKMKRKLTLKFEGMRGNSGPMVVKK